MPFLDSYLRRHPIALAALFGALLVFTLYMGFRKEGSASQLPALPTPLTLADIAKRIDHGSTELYVELIDGQLNCSSLHYSATTYAYVVKEYSARVWIANQDNSIVLYSIYNGTPSCDQIASKPLTGIVTKTDPAAVPGMFNTNYMGVRNYPSARFLDFCGGCTKATGYRSSYIYYGVSAICLFFFLFSLYYQWAKWRGDPWTQNIH